MDKMATSETTKKTTCRLSIAAALLLLIGGIWGAGCLLSFLPTAMDISAGKFILYEIIGLTPLVAGGMWLRHLYRNGKRLGKNATWSNGMIGGMIFGMLLVFVGMLLFALNSGIFIPEWTPILISWQMLLIVIGIIQFWKMDITAGIVFLSVGTFFVIPKINKMFPGSLDIVPGFGSTYWPVLLVIFGIAVIAGFLLNRTLKPTRNSCCNTHKRNEPTPTYTASTVGTVNYNLLFTGSEQVFLGPEFRGGKISVVFGGLELDLRRTSLPEGTNYLKVDCTFGGVEIKAPDNWYIEIESHSLFGGVSDSRRFYREQEQEKRKLVIIANCTFGGCTIE